MMRMNRMIWIIFFIIAFLITIPIIAQADLKDIMATLHPSISIQEEYSNNLDLAPRDRIDDFITTISPGLRFSTLPRSEVTGQFRGAPGVPATVEEKYGIDLDYRLGLVFYAKETDRNFVSHSGTLNAWYAPDQKLTFRVREYLIRSEEPRERDFSPEALSNQFLLGTQRQRAIYIRNVFEPSVEYRFGTEDQISLNYRSNIYENESRLVQDSREDFINPRFSYWFNIRNGIVFEYGLTLANFETSPDFTGHLARGRYIYRFNPRTSAFGEYQFLTRKFDSPGIDYDIHRPGVGVEHAFSPTVSVRGQVGYFWQNPDKGSTISGVFYDMALTKRAERTTYALSFLGGYTEDFFTAENLGFTKYHRVLGTITHQLKERLTVGGYGSYEQAKSEPDTKDRIWGIGVNGTYQLFRWMSLTLDLSHRKNHSSVEDRGYSEDRAMLRMTATY